MGKPTADLLQEQWFRPQDVRNAHLHRGEFRGSEFVQHLMMSSFQDPTFDQACRVLHQITQAAIIEWLRQCGTFTMLPLKRRRSWRRWIKEHWSGYLRARWLEHLHGKCFWVELDRGDFGLLQRRFHDNSLLLDRILDRLKAGQENLDIILWALDWSIPMEPVREILEALDINSRRLAHRFDPVACSATLPQTSPVPLCR